MQGIETCFETVPLEKVSVKLPVTGSCGAPNSKPDAVKSIVSVIRLADPMAGHIKARDRISAAMLAVIGALRFLIFSSVTSIARGRKGRALRSTIFIHRDNAPPALSPRWACYMPPNGYGTPRGEAVKYFDTVLVNVPAVRVAGAGRLAGSSDGAALCAPCGRSRRAPYAQRLGAVRQR